MPPPWIPGRNKGKTKANKLVSRKVEQNIHLLARQVLLSAAHHVQDTMLGSGNTTYDPCYQEAGEEKYLNTFLLKVY